MRWLVRVPVVTWVALGLCAVVASVMALSTVRLQLGAPFSPDALPTPAPLGVPAARVDRSSEPGALGAGDPTSDPAVALTGGTARLFGLVQDATGAAIPLAQVELTRFVGPASASVVVSADGEGRYALAEAVGGRWRVTAWQAAVLPAGASMVVFVPAGANTQVDVRAADRPPVRLDLAESPGAEPQTTTTTTTTNTTAATTTTLTLTTNQATVGVDGRLGPDRPVPGSVTLVWPAGYTGPSTVEVSATGTARVTVQCSPAASTGPGSMLASFVASTPPTPTPPTPTPASPPASTTSTTTPRLAPAQTATAQLTLPGCAPPVPPPPSTTTSSSTSTTTPPTTIPPGRR